MKRTALRACGRVGLLVLGVAVVAFLVHRAGPREVGAILRGAWAFVPALAALEIGMASCEVMSLRAQLGEHAGKVRPRSWVCASAYAYALQILFPVGRAAGELARISVLSRDVSVARCAVASVGYQASNLYAVAALSAVNALIAFHATGARALSVGEALNFLVVGAIATSVTLALRSKGASAFVAKRFKLLTSSAGELRDATQTSVSVRRGAAWCTLGRFVQLAQYGVCVLAIGGTTGIVQASLAHGTQLVGASLGDVIPGQVGAVEGAYAAFAGAIRLTPERVLALPLLIRVTQITLAATCLLVATLVRRPAEARS
jgi:hypothetical protein